MYVCMLVNIHGECLYVFECVLMCVCVIGHMNVYVCARACVCACVYVNLFVCMFGFNNCHWCVRARVCVRVWGGQELLACVRMCEHAHV